MSKHYTSSLQVDPGSLDSCDAVAEIDFGPEEKEEEFDDYYSEEYAEESVQNREEIKAVIEEKLSEQKQEEQSDQPAKPAATPKKLSVKAAESSGAPETRSLVLLLLPCLVLLYRV